MFNNPIYESAFKELDLLYEQDFNLNKDSADDIKDFVDEETEDTDIDVIDLDAEEEDDLDESNIGKIILQCPCCETIVCKNKDEIELPEDCDDDTDCMVQVGEQCPVCFSEEGYKIIGQVAPYEEVEVEIESKDEEEDSDDADDDTEMETDFDDSDDDVIEDKTTDEEKNKNESLITESKCEDGCCENDTDDESLTEDIPPELSKDLVDGIPSNDDKDIEESLTEGLNDINLETDTDRISIHAEQKAENGEEMIAPLDFQAANEIVDNQLSDEAATDYLDNIDAEETTELPLEDENIGEPLESELPEEDIEEDVPIDDFDEESFDDLGESYFKSVYDNVTSYLTESVHEKGDKLIVEGIITFDSGNQRKTQFVVEGNSLSNTGSCQMLAENLQITPGQQAFNINGTLDNGKFISESLSYKYDANGTEIKGNINLRK